MRSLAVQKYSIDNLCKLLVDCAAEGTTRDKVDGKSHKIYFEEYFRDIGASTIMIEKPYVDRDFLEDYAAYYVRCFHPYKRFCSRLHFFTLEFEQKDLDALLQGSTSSVLTAEKLQSAYLGFIVVKPLPEALIGRTCLRVYDGDGNRRHYPIVREYPVNLAGLELSVESLAFQEQDKVAAACATSALWSAFHKTGISFQHEIPTPVEITQRAIKRFPVDYRTLPSRGLTLEQMAAGVREVGLEPNIISAENTLTLQSTLYAYVCAGIPCLLLCKVIEVSQNSWKDMGNHALVITGFSLGRADCAPYPDTGFLAHATRMDEIYVHDDQVGPFARMVFDTCSVCPFLTLSSSWTIGSNSAIGSIRMVPEGLLLPLYHKIRIPYRHVEQQVIYLDAALELFRADRHLTYSKRIEWGIRLSTVNDFKNSIMDNKIPVPEGAYRQDLLEYPLPRFLWRAIARVEGAPKIEILFDATDIESGNMYLRTVNCDSDFIIAAKKATDFYRSNATESPLGQNALPLLDALCKSVPT